MPLRYSTTGGCSKKKGVLKIFAKLTGKHLSQSLLFNKVAGLRLWRMYFPMNFAKLLRIPILKNICERLFLVAGWRTTQKLSRRDLLLLACLVYINTSVASFFSSFIYDFLIHISLVLTKLSLQTDNYMENFDRL